ncbi:MAG: hypothetical protein JW748_04775 [Anaerolineales bacterium]|nr:hypothetical protein [Anaerolineales bacterium]
MQPMEDRMAWLLDAGTPSIVYQVRRDLTLPRSSARELQKAKKGIMQAGAAPAILERQSKRGNWKIDRGYYGPKFYSTHWSMVLLAELGADGSDGRFRRGVEYMLGATRDPVEEGLEQKTFGWSCLYGNILRYALQAPVTKDSRVENLIRFCARAMAAGPCDCRYSYGRACAWGAARVLWGLAAVPKRSRSKEVGKAIRLGIRFLLEDHRLEKADYPGGRVNPLWFKLSFPLFYHADILFTLRVLDEVDALDHRGARAALDWLEAKRRPDGRWKGTSPFRTRTWREMGDPEETSRWVTLQAMRILRHAGRRV